MVISPCRDEAKYMRQTLDSVIAQSVRPTKWVIVDDGSTDETPRILAEYAKKYDWMQIVTRSNRGQRSVGPGVIEAFYNGSTWTPVVNGTAYTAQTTDIPTGAMNVAAMVDTLTGSARQLQIDMFSMYTTELGARYP